jgi:hypothetical protein
MKGACVRVAVVRVDDTRDGARAAKKMNCAFFFFFFFFGRLSGATKKIGLHSVRALAVLQ